MLVTTNEHEALKHRLGPKGLRLHMVMTPVWVIYHLIALLSPLLTLQILAFQRLPFHILLHQEWSAKPPKTSQAGLPYVNSVGMSGISVHHIAQEEWMY